MEVDCGPWVLGVLGCPWGSRFLPNKETCLSTGIETRRETTGRGVSSVLFDPVSPGNFPGWIKGIQKSCFHVIDIVLYRFSQSDPEWLPYYPQALRQYYDHLGPSTGSTREPISRQEPVCP